MIKQLSLLKKFVIGFALILMLLIALSIVAYQGLSGIVEHTRTSDSINAIGSSLGLARLHEQELMVRRTSESENKVRLALTQMKTDITRAESANAEKQIGMRLASIRSRMGEYEQSFDDYVALVDAQSEKATQMREKARSALDLAYRIRDREETQLETIRRDSGAHIAQKTALVDAAAQIYNTALEIKVNRVALMNNDEASLLAQWKGDNKKLESQVVKLRSQLQNPQQAKSADLILKRQQTYMADVLAYLDTLAYEELNRMIKSVKAYTRSVTSLQFDLRQDLDFFVEDTQIEIDEKLAVAQSVNTMANLLMNARLQEKEIAAMRDTSAAGEVTQAIQGISLAGKNLKARVENEAILVQIEPIIDAAADYDVVFNQTVDLMNRQRQAEKRMVDAAREVAEVCTAAKADQREKVDRQIVKSKTFMLVGTLVAVIVGIICAIGCAAIVVRPVRRTADMIKDIAQGEGDLTQRLAVGSQDEIGQMAGWFNAFISKLHDIVRNISEYFQTVSASAHQLLLISKQMDDSVHNMSDKSAAVARAADEMSTRMNSVAVASEQASTNMGSVASEMDQMNLTVSAIGASSGKARDVTDRAVAEARQASSKIAGLDNAVAEIDKVTQVITDISDQTNLLALNATIEAARAGEAGKGFAVVANEIKDLARQTAEATKGIKLEIDGIQSSTAETVSDISRIGEVIGEVDDIVSSIAMAVEEQAAATENIAGNVVQASAGISDVTENVTRSSVFAGEIAADISEVHRIAGTIAQNSGQVSTNAGELTRLAEDLKSMIGEFKVEASDPVGTDAPLALDGPNLITWDDKLQFGIENIDRQHRRLVELINRFHGALRKRAGRAVLGPILEELTEYTVKHFADEERCMAAAGYAELERHKQIHQELVEQVVAFKERFEAGSATVTIDLMTFLGDWLVNHIDGIDRKYVPVLKLPDDKSLN